MTTSVPSFHSSSTFLLSEMSDLRLPLNSECLLKFLLLVIVPTSESVVVVGAVSVEILATF